MELVTPGLGLIFWMTLAFAVVLWILAKYAWNPILKTIKAREESIEQALQHAEQARQELRNLKATNEEMIRQAKEERENIVRETLLLKDRMIAEAKEKASEEAQLIIQKTREMLEYEKQAALVDLKNQIGLLSIDIAEKLLTRELSDKEVSRQYVEKLVNEVDLN